MFAWTRRISAIAAGLCLVAPVFSQLAPEEKKGIEDTMFLANMSLKDLEYARRPFNDAYRLKLVNLAIDKPLEAADAIMNLHALGSKAMMPQVIQLARTQILEDPTDVPGVTETVAGAIPPSIPTEYDEIINQMAGYVSDCNATIRKAFEKLAPVEKRQLIESLPQWAVEDPTIKFDFVKQKQLPQADILKLLDKVDLKMLRAAGEVLSKNVEGKLGTLRNLAKASKWEGFVKFRWGQINVVFAGVGDDTHREMDAQLVIDLGGNDRYYGRSGAGVGYASVLIDCAGDDLYKVPDVGAGCGLMGVGLAYDLGGHDNFRGKSLCFGCGLAGVGVLFKDGGDDSYKSVALTQGFGEFGIGILADTRGNDSYEASLYAQGAARTQGVGWLIDRAGNDTYRAGGLILNSPLFKDVTYSNAQGYGAGYREDDGGLSGGVGFLTDMEGSDTYIGETYCQAASYWFSLGSLYDAKGNDTYSAYHYAQASAMHMTAAYLFDLSGDDDYIVNFGACHGIGHDYGVAFFLDREGNDVYAARDSRPGVGNANGVGIFVDAKGEDRFWGPPGVGNPARGSGSIGLFVDIDGGDKFSEGFADGQATVKDSWGIAYSPEPKAQTAAADTPERPKPTPGSLAKPSDDEMEKIYAKATQWNVGTAQAEVADNLDKLMAIGMPAVQWMLDKKLAKASHLELRAYVAVINVVGDPARAALAAKVSSKDDDEARNALSIAIDTKAVQAGPLLADAMKRPALMRIAARAAGSLGSKESVPALMTLANNDDKLTALAAVVSLGQMADPSSLNTGQALLGSPEMPLRKAAIQLVAKFPEEMTAAKVMIADNDEKTARTGIEVLGAMGSPDALALIGPLLTDGRPGVRIQALLALNGRAPDAYKQAVLDRRRDPNPLVRAIAMKIDPGR